MNPETHAVTTISHPHPSTTPTIQDRQQFEAVVENIVQLKLQRAELENAQEEEIASIREKYRAPLAELERYLTLETTWAETWARNNPEAFGEGRSLDCANGTVGFRTTSPRVERASRKWTWTAISIKLAESPWGRRYLRIPSPEVNKEMILAERANLPADELRLAGIKILDGDRFFVMPNQGTENSTSEDAGAEWQEAA